MTKKKTDTNVPSQKDLEDLGLAKPKEKLKEKPKGGCRNIVLAGVVVVIGFMIIGYKPRMSTSAEQAVATQVAAMTSQAITRTEAANISTPPLQNTKAVNPETTLTPSGDPILNNGALNWEIKRIETRNWAGEWKPLDGKTYLTVFGTLTNPYEKAARVGSNHVWARVDGNDYRPQTSVMDKMRDDLNLMDYIGPSSLNVLPGERIDVFVTFEVPNDWKQIGLKLDDAFIWLVPDSVLTIAQISPSETPSAAPTLTPTIAAVVGVPSTAAPGNTVIPVVVVQPATEPVALSEEEALDQLPAVTFIGRIERRDGDYFAIVKTHPNFNKESFAQLLYIQAGKVDFNISRFAVKIDDDSSDPLWWIYEDNEWRSSQDAPQWADFSTFGSASPVATQVEQTTEVIAVAAKTYYAEGSVNVRSCPRTTCSKLGSLAQGDALTVDGMIDGDPVNVGNKIWYRMKIYGMTGYVYSDLVNTVKPATTTTTGGGSSTNNQSVVPVPQSVPTSGPGFVCPSNCTEAKAMGVSAEQAAACGLDRDGDGVACYGD